MVPRTKSLAAIAITIDVARAIMVRRIPIGIYVAVWPTITVSIAIVTSSIHGGTLLSLITCMSKVS
jgi:uncharacterized membrane protein